MKSKAKSGQLSALEEWKAQLQPIDVGYVPATVDSDETSSIVTALEEEKAQG